MSCQCEDCRYENEKKYQQQRANKPLLSYSNQSKKYDDNQLRGIFTSGDDKICPPDGWGGWDVVLLVILIIAGIGILVVLPIIVYIKSNVVQRDAFRESADRVGSAIGSGAGRLGSAIGSGAGRAGSAAVSGAGKVARGIGSGIGRVAEYVQPIDDMKMEKGSNVSDYFSVNHGSI